MYLAAVNPVWANICTIEMAKITRSSFDSAVEVEIGVNNNVIELFTTTDGTLAPVVGSVGVKGLPPDILAALQEFVGSEADPLTASWDLLTSSEKMEVVMATANASGQSFFADRKVPGLVYRPRIKLSFATSVRFLGNDLQPGTYDFSTEDIFKNTAIEFMAPNRMRSNLGFELHVRSDLPAAENVKTARGLETALTGGHHGFHLHVVGPESAKPTRWDRFLLYCRSFFRNMPWTRREVAAFQASDFVRRTMLYFEFKMIERGFPMTDIIDPESQSKNFFPVEVPNFLYLNKSLGGQPYLEPFFQPPNPGAFSKGGTVGYRAGRSYYDVAEVWGIEIRYLAPFMDMEKLGKSLPFIQKKMTSGEFFLSETEVRDHLRLMRDQGLNYKYAVENLLYASENFIHDPRGIFRTDQVQHEIKQNDLVRMLFHDWSADPWVMLKPGMGAKIASVQDYCQSLLFRTAGKSLPSTEVMKIFIKKSSLQYEINRLYEGD